MDRLVKAQYKPNSVIRKLRFKGKRPNRRIKAIWHEFINKDYSGLQEHVRSDLRRIV